MITDDELRALIELEAKASKLWYARPSNVQGPWTGIYSSAHAGHPACIGYAILEEDANLIVLARNALPAIATELLALRDEVEMLRAVQLQMAQASVAIGQAAGVDCSLECPPDVVIRAIEAIRERVLAARIIVDSLRGDGGIGDFYVELCQVADLLDVGRPLSKESQ